MDNDSTKLKERLKLFEKQLHTTRMFDKGKWYEILDKEGNVVSGKAFIYLIRHYNDISGLSKLGGIVVTSDGYNVPDSFYEWELGKAFTVT